MIDQDHPAVPPMEAQACHGHLSPRSWRPAPQCRNAYKVKGAGLEHVRGSGWSTGQGGHGKPDSHWSGPPSTLSTLPPEQVNIRKVLGVESSVCPVYSPSG